MREAFWYDRKTEGGSAVWMRRLECTWEGSKRVWQMNRKF